jgi:hypothetical protein
MPPIFHALTDPLDRKQTMKREETRLLLLLTRRAGGWPGHRPFEKQNIGKDTKTGNTVSPLRYAYRSAALLAPLLSIFGPREALL